MYKLEFTRVDILPLLVSWMECPTEFQFSYLYFVNRVRTDHLFMNYLVSIKATVNRCYITEDNNKYKSTHLLRIKGLTLHAISNFVRKPQRMIRTMSQLVYQPRVNYNERTHLLQSGRIDAREYKPGIGSNIIYKVLYLDTEMRQ